jgi:Kelch motif
MGDSGQGGPVRLAILLASAAGLIILGIKTTGGDGASASRRAAAGHGTPGRIVAVASRRRPPAVVRGEAALPQKRGAATIGVAGATYMIGGTQRTAHGGRVPVGSILRTDGPGPPTRVAKLPTAVTGAAPAAVGDRLYAIGGRLANGKPSNQVQEYDIATEHSVIAARLPTPLWDTRAITLNGFVYVLGGLTRSGPSDAILVFDPWRDTVSRAGHLPVPASGGRATAVRGRRGYLAGANVPGSSRLSFALTLRPRG